MRAVVEKNNVIDVEFETINVSSPHISMLDAQKYTEKALIAQDQLVLLQDHTAYSGAFFETKAIDIPFIIVTLMSALVVFLACGGFVFFL